MNFPSDAAIDQSNVPDGYYRRTNGMLHQKPADSQQQSSPGEPIDLDDPAALRTLAKSALVEIVQTAPRNVALVGAIRELLDRVDGKAVQTLQVDQRITHNTLAVHMTSEQLDREIARLRGGAPMMIDVTPEK